MKIIHKKYIYEIKRSFLCKSEKEKKKKGKKFKEGTNKGRKNIQKYEEKRNRKPKRNKKAKKEAQMIEDKGENSHLLDLISFSFNVSESIVINEH